MPSAEREKANASSFEGRDCAMQEAACALDSRRQNRRTQKASSRCYRLFVSEWGGPLPVRPPMLSFIRYSEKKIRRRDRYTKPRQIVG